MIFVEIYFVALSMVNFHGKCVLEKNVCVLIADDNSNSRFSLVVFYIVFFPTLSSQIFLYPYVSGVFVNSIN